LVLETIEVGNPDFEVPGRTLSDKKPSAIEAVVPCLMQSAHRSGHFANQAIHIAVSPTRLADRSLAEPTAQVTIQRRESPQLFGEYKGLQQTVGAQLLAPGYKPHDTHGSEFA
jgi:hypothetical protein